MTAINAAFRVGGVAVKPVWRDITTLPADALVQPSGTSPLDSPVQAGPWAIESDSNGLIGQALRHHVPLQMGSVIATSFGLTLEAKHLGGAKYNVSVEERKGIVIEDRASVSLAEEPARPWSVT